MERWRQCFWPLGWHVGGFSRGDRASRVICRWWITALGYNTINMAIVTVFVMGGIRAVTEIIYLRRSCRCRSGCGRNIGRTFCGCVLNRMAVWRRSAVAFDTVFGAIVHVLIVAGGNHWFSAFRGDGISTIW